MKKKDSSENYLKFFILLWLLVLIPLLIVWSYNNFKLENALSILDPNFKIPEKISTKTKSIPIGGPFKLIDHNGKVKKHSDFLGKFVLMYFGYTYCPDVCPTSLTKMTDAMNLLGSKANNIIPVFITIDPKRDTIKQLKMYISYFHPAFFALTGTEEEIKKITKTYRVYFAKQKANIGDTEDYLVDHSSIMLLLNKKGKFLSHFSHKASARDIATKIEKYIELK